MKKLVLVFSVTTLMLGTTFAFANNNNINSIDHLAIENSQDFTIDDSTNLNYTNEDIESRLLVNRNFKLSVNQWTTIGSENNTLNRTIRIENSNINTGNIVVEVRDSNNNILGGHLNLAPNRGIDVNIPWNSGTYTVRARAVSQAGDYNIVVSRR